MTPSLELVRVLNKILELEELTYHPKIILWNTFKLYLKI